MARRKRRRGRPEHRPTKLTRERVAVAAGGGMAHEEIALGLGIARNTLERHYERELSLGAAEKRLEVVNALHKAAKKGRVAAIKEYLANTPKVAPPPAKPEEKPASTLGKKEQQQAAAVTAQVGTEWHDLLPGPATKQ